MSIPEPSKDELIRLWESGVPLDSAWVEFAVSLDRFALAALRMHPDDDLKVHGLDNRDYKALINSGWLPRTSEGRKKKLEVITTNERTHLLRDIYAGRLWAIGFQTLPSNLVKPIHVPRELFFDQAGDPDRRRNIDWNKSAISIGTDSFSEVRVTRPPLGSEDSLATATTAETIRSEGSNTATTQGISNPKGDTRTLRGSSKEENAPGRPSRANVIRAAICEHAKTDPHLERPRDERFRNYRFYVRSQGYDPHRDVGFNDKTFEKYELEFRRKSNKSK